MDYFKQEFSLLLSLPLPLSFNFVLHTLFYFEFKIIKKNFFLLAKENSMNPDHNKNSSILLYVVVTM